MLSEQKQDLADPWRHNSHGLLLSYKPPRCRGWLKETLWKALYCVLKLSVACIIYQPSPEGTRDHYFASAPAHPFQPSTDRKESGLEGFLVFPSCAAVFFHTGWGQNRDYHIAATSCFMLMNTGASSKLCFISQRSGCSMHSQPGCCSQALHAPLSVLKLKDSAKGQSERISLPPHPTLGWFLLVWVHERWTLEHDTSYTPPPIS